MFLFLGLALLFLPFYSSLSDDDKIKLLKKVTHKNQLPTVMQSLNFTTGAELGVYDGTNAMVIMKKWTTCKKFILVDLWAHQTDNYHDTSNHEQSQHNANLETTKKRMAPYKDAVIYIRNYTTFAALEVEDESLDFIYVDARHDYCGVRDDIKSWWPKLTQGGVMAGHDYMTAADRRRYAKDDWGICFDGSRNDGAVKGAVIDFAKANNLEIFTTKSDYPYLSWIYSPKGLIRTTPLLSSSSVTPRSHSNNNINNDLSPPGVVSVPNKINLRAKRTGQGLGNINSNNNKEFNA